jgi:hypothetical protein
VSAVARVPSPRGPAPRLELQERWAARMFPRRSCPPWIRGTMWSPVNGSPGFAGAPQIQQLNSSRRTCRLARSCAHPRRGTACSGQRALPLGLPQTRQGLRRRFIAFRLSAVSRGFAGRRVDPAGRLRATCASRGGNSMPATGRGDSAVLLAESEDFVCGCRYRPERSIVVAPFKADPTEAPPMRYPRESEPS